MQPQHIQRASELSPPIPATAVEIDLATVDGSIAPITPTIIEGMSIAGEQNAPPLTFRNRIARVVEGYTSWAQSNPETAAFVARTAKVATVFAGNRAAGRLAAQETSTPVGEMLVEMGTRTLHTIVALGEASLHNEAA